MSRSFWYCLTPPPPIITLFSNKAFHNILDTPSSLRPWHHLWTSPLILKKICVKRWKLIESFIRINTPASFSAFWKQSHVNSGISFVTSLFNVHSKLAVLNRKLIPGVPPNIKKILVICQYCKWNLSIRGYLKVLVWLCKGSSNKKRLRNTVVNRSKLNKRTVTKNLNYFISWIVS